MKKIIRILMIVVFFACASSGCGEDSDYEDIPCGYHNGNRLYKGPKGGCYYYNSNDNKTYVDRSECNC